jgi:molybdenum cofactor cytidylyltransferase
MIDGIILASGFSRRMGKNKLLLSLGSETVVEKVIQAAKASGLRSIILVCRDDGLMEIGRNLGVEPIRNSNAELGQAESVKLGVAASGADGYLFLAADQPYITPEFLDLLLQRYMETGKGIVAPVFNGRIRMPILFSKRYRDDLLKIKGEHGGFEIIESNPEDTELVDVEDKRLVADVDTLDDYKWILANGGEGS